MFQNNTESINAWSDSDKYRAQADDLIKRFEEKKFGQKLKKLLTLVALTNN